MNTSAPQNEISPKISETFDFFQNSAKWISVGIMLGLVFSIIYLVSTKSQYEASVLINLRTIDNKTSILNSNYFFSKLHEPSSYSTKVLASCSPNLAFNVFIKNLKIIPSPSNPIQIDFRYLSHQPKEALACLEGVVEVVNSLQMEEAIKIIKGMEGDVIDLQEKINTIKSASLIETDSQILAIYNYMSVRDELNMHKSKLFELKSRLHEAKNKIAQEVSPANISVNLLGPVRKLVLLNGLFSGLIFGLLIQLFINAKSIFLYKNS